MFAGGKTQDTAAHNDTKKSSLITFQMTFPCKENKNGMGSYIVQTPRFTYMYCERATYA
jgi:hypothetical protein